MRDRIAKGLPFPSIAIAIAAWMHYVVKIAYTDAALNDPMAKEIIAKAKLGLEAGVIIDNLLSLEAIFGTDLPANNAFKKELLEKFTGLAQDSAVSTYEYIKL